MTDTQQASAGQPGGASQDGAPFGRMLTAMITPFSAGGALDTDGAARLATYLVDDMRNDGLVISGTTGESPTTTDAEKDRLLLVTPYYNKPPQEGLVAHFSAAADATGLPCMLYDIPGRTGMAIKKETLIRLAQHPRIVAVKDAKADFGATSEVMLATDLVFYSGDDILNLPWLSVGAAGFVSVVGHVVGDRLHEMIDAYRAGRVGEARQIHLDVLPVIIGIMTRTQGAIMAKAALGLVGLPRWVTRLPLVDATPAQLEQLRTDLVAGGVKLPGTVA